MHPRPLPLVLAALLTLAAPAAFASGPPLLSLQGSLRTVAGLSVDGAYKLAVTLHDAASGGKDLWSEVHNAVPVTSGVFQVTLGSKEPFPEGLFVQQPELFVGVSVDNEPELPRTRMARVAWAFSAAHAQNALSAKALGCSGCISEGHLGFAVVKPDALAAALSSMEGKAGQMVAQHAADEDAHHTRYTDAEAKAAVGPHIATGIGCTGCVSKEHLGFDVVTPDGLTSALSSIEAKSGQGLASHTAKADAHHTRYTDEEAKAAVGPHIATGIACTACVGASALQDGAVAANKLGPVPWSKLDGIPDGFADEVDDGLLGKGAAGALAVFTSGGGLAGSVATQKGDLLGIGTPSPAVRLDVAGAIRVGDAAQACDAALAGAIRFDEKQKLFRGCDGKKWVSMAWGNDGSTMQVTITNPSTVTLSDHQVRIPASPFIDLHGNRFVVLDAVGSKVPYCFETAEGACGTDNQASTVVWVRVPQVPGSGTATLTFQKDLTNNASSGAAVFLLYDGFDSGAVDATLFSTVTTACNVSVSDGWLVAGPHKGNNEVCGVNTKTFTVPAESLVTARVQIATTGPSDSDMCVLLGPASLTTNTGTTANQVAGLVVDDETPATYLNYYGKSDEISKAQLRGKTYLVDLTVTGGQLSACHSVDGKCSGKATFNPSYAHVFLGSWAYGGIPWSFDYVRVRRAEPAALKVAFAE